MAQSKDTTSEKKRVAIDKAERNMFIAVAVGSIAFAVAVVLTIFFFKKMLYNGAVIGEKQETVATLRANNQTIEGLSDDVRGLSNNPGLVVLKLEDGGDPLTVIADAIPALGCPNEAAVGASLTDKLLVSPGITLEVLNVTPSGMSGGTDCIGITDDRAIQTTEFTFTVNGNLNSLIELIDRLERSIRQVDIQKVAFEWDQRGVSMTLTGTMPWTYPTTIQLTMKEVEP